MKRTMVGAALLTLFSAASAQEANPGVLGVPQGQDVSDFSKLPRLEPGQAAPAPRRAAHPRRTHESTESLPIPAATSPPTKPARRVFGGAAQTAGGANFVPAGTGNSPQPSASFQAILDNATSFNPDTQGAVGTNHIMTMTASEVQVLDRLGNQLSRVTLSNFWGNLGTNGQPDIFDPRLVYEPYNQRWIAAGSANPGISNRQALLIAVSQTSNPGGTWNRYFIRVDLAKGLYADSPTIGFSRDTIIVQANMFYTTNDQHASFDLWAFDKASLYAGAASPTFTRFSLSSGFTTNDFGPPANAMLPAATYDNTVTTNYLVANWNGNTPDGGYLRVYYIYKNAVNAYELKPGNVSFEFPFGASPAWDTFSPNDDNFARQSGTTNRIYMGDARIQNCVYRNETLWVAQTVFLPADGPATHCAVQWWEMTPGGVADDGVSLTGATVIQRGLIEDTSGAKSYGYPSIAVSRRNDVVVGYSRFAANQFPSANFSFRVDADVFSSLRSDVVYKSGEAKFVVDDFGINHWGDSSAAVVDPNNDTDLWTIQEYASVPVSGIDRWGTWWCRVSPPADLSVTMTGTPNPVVAGSNVTYSITINTTNDRIQSVNGVRLNDTLPAGAILVSAIPSQGACGLTNGIVTCDFGNVGDTGRVTATIVATLNNSGTANNTVTVSAYGPEIASGDNTATVNTTVSAAADLSVLLSDFPDPITLSNTLTYVITVTNRGPSAALSVLLTNVLPANMTYLSTLPSQGSCARNSNVVNCALGTIAMQSVATVQIQVSPTVPGNYTNRANVVSASFDPVFANNTNVIVTLANAAPSIGQISDRTINEDTSLSAIAFTIGDFETPASSLVLTGFCSNPAIVPNANIVFGGSGSNRTVTVTPALNANGIVSITRIVSDPFGASATNTFQLTILPINDPPSINDIPDFAIDEDSTTNITFTIGDIETPASLLSVSAASSATFLVPNANLNITGTTSTRTLSIAPAPNQSGTTTITVTVGDGTNTTSDTFLLTVRAVNDPPTITTITNRSVNEDTSTGPIPFTVADIETTGSNLVLTAFSSNTNLVPISNITFAIVSGGTNRTVSVLPGTNQFGTATITIRAADTDGAAVSNSFQLVINPVNDAPTLNAISDIVTNEDSGLITVPLSGISVGAPNEIQDLLITATSGNTALIPIVNVVYTSGNPTGALTFTPVANSNGVSLITVTAFDGASSNSTTVRTFTVTINAVNDAPFISDILDRSINEDTSTGIINFTIGDVDSPIASLSLIGSSSDQAMVPNGNISFGGTGSNRTVVVTPTPNANGTCTITVSVNDGGATNSDSFVLTILPINDPPTIAAITDRTINEDTLTNIPVTIGDIDNPPANLTVTASSSNPGIVPNINLNVSGTTATRTLSVLPATNQFGSCNITVTVSDPSGASNSTSFALTVTPVNDPPTLALIPDVTVNENDPPHQVVLTGLSGGPINEPQPITLSASSGATAIIPNPTVSYTNGNSTAVLTFSSAQHAFGDVTLTVNVTDTGTSNQTTIRTFVVHVLNVNDLPVLSDVPPQSMIEDSTLVVNFSVFDYETAASNLTYQAFSSNQELFDDNHFVFGGNGTNRTLTLRPITNAFSSGEIVIQVTDADGGVATSSFEINVTGVNDPPSVSGLSNLSVNEDTSTGPLPFILDDPDNDLSLVSITVSSSNPILVPPAGLTLGGVSRNRTLTAVPATNQFGSTTISVTVSDGVASATNSFVLTVLAVNDLPVISDITDRVIDEDTTTGPISFTVGDVETTAGALTLLAASSNTTLVPTNNIAFGGSGATRTVTVTPVADRSGTATITITVTDTNGGSSSDTFLLTVNAVNDPPTLTGLGPISVRGNSSSNLFFIVNDVDNPATSLVVTSTSLNTVLIPNSGLVPGGSGSNRTLTITPAPNQFGQATILTVVRDPAGDSVTNSMIVSVIDLNFPPTISDILDRSAPEDAPVVISFTVSDPETASTNLIVTGTSSNPALIPNSAIVFGGSAGNRTITLTPLRDKTGSANITVTVTDAGGSEATDGFTLTITNINDPPTISGLPALTINEDTSTGPLSFTVGDVETAPASLSVIASSSNQGLVPNGNIIPGGSGADRTIVITPAPDQFGFTTITISVSDGNGGTTNTSFILTVAAVNDPPTLAAISDVTVPEDSPTQGVPLSGISPGPGETQTLTITAASSNPGLIPTPLITYFNGNTTGVLTFTPVPNATGSALISVTVNDGTGFNSNVVRTFTITVTPSNDAPAISAIPAQMMLEDTVLTVPFIVSDPDGSSTTLSLSASSGNTVLLPNASIFFSGADSNRTVTFVPQPDLFGTSLVSIAVSDGIVTNSTVFQLSVVAVNDAPKINPLTNVTAIVSPGVLTIPLQGISAGATNETETVTFSTTNSMAAGFWTTVPFVTYTSGSSTGLLTFRPGNNQTGSATIGVVANDGRGSNSITVRTVVLNVRPSGDVLPTLSTIPNQTINEDTVLGPINFTVRDAETAAASLVVTAVSTNEALIPPSSIVFGGSGSNRTVTLTPAPNASGVTLISLTVRDGSSGASNMNFVVTVNSLNDAPIISPIANISIPENKTSPPILFDVSDVETPPASLNVSATSGNNLLIPNANIVVGGSGTNRSLLITPATNQTGSAVITVSAGDGTVTTTTTFTLTVNAVNDPPTISDIPDQTTFESTSTAPIAFTITDPDTALASLALSSTSSNPSLIPTNNITFGGSAGSRTVTLTPLPGQTGTAIITVKVSDGGSTNGDSFLFTVRPFNRAPTLNPISNITLNQNAPLQTVPLANITSGSVTETQTLFIAASSSNPALVPNPTVNYVSPATTGSLTFTPAPNANGTATITVTVNDAQSQSNIFTRTFTVTINAAPVIAIVPNQVIDEDAVAFPVSFSVSDAETAVASITTTATSSNTGLIPNSGVTVVGTGTTRSLTLTPRANLAGNSFISITASDPNGNNTVYTFLVTVASINDAPTLNPIQSISLPTNAPLQTVPLSGISSGATNESQVLTVTASSSNPSIVPNPGILYTSPNSTGTLTFTPVAGATGIVVITVQVMDDGGVSRGGSNTTTRTFSVSIGTAPPQLRIDLAGKTRVISWPTSAGSSWLLLGASAVSGTPTWRAVPVTPVQAAGRYWVTNSGVDPRMFFRLCNGCSAVYSPPELSVRRLATNDFRISWSAAFGDFILESRLNATSGSWSNVNTLPVVISGTNNVILNATGSRATFRLRGP